MTGSNSIPLGRLRPDAPESTELIAKKSADDKDYDQHVRELALDKRAKPKDRTKTEEELALEAKESLEKAERKRMKRMMGEVDDSSDDDDRKSGGRKRARKDKGADDLDDDFPAEDAEWDSLGAGLGGEAAVEGSDDDDDDEGEGDDDEDGEGEGMPGLAGERSDSEEEGHEQLALAPAPKGRKSKHKAKTDTKELPFTFPCPETNDEFLTIVEDVEIKDVPTVVQRIRALYHPSLAEGNTVKLQVILTYN